MKSIRGSKLAPLTAKMEAFAQGVADGLNQSDAYRAAYNCANMKASTIHEAASRLAADYKVLARIKALQAQTAQALATRRGWDRERFIHEGETNLKMARHLGQFAAANKALELMFRASGLLTERPRAAPIKTTQIMNNKNHGRDSAGDAPALEASYRVLPDEDVAE